MSDLKPRLVSQGYANPVAQKHAERQQKQARIDSSVKPSAIKQSIKNLGESGITDHADLAAQLNRARDLHGHGGNRETAISEISAHNQHIQEVKQTRGAKYDAENARTKSLATVLETDGASKDFKEVFGENHPILQESSLASNENISSVHSHYSKQYTDARGQLDTAHNELLRLIPGLAAEHYREPKIYTDLNGDKHYVIVDAQGAMHTLTPEAVIKYNELNTARETFNTHESNFRDVEQQIITHYMDAINKANGDAPHLQDLRTKMKAFNDALSEYDGIRSRGPSTGTSTSGSSTNSNQANSDSDKGFNWANLGAEKFWSWTGGAVRWLGAVTGIGALLALLFGQNKSQSMDPQAMAALMAMQGGGGASAAQSPRMMSSGLGSARVY